jgi:hypothetical protein
LTGNFGSTPQAVEFAKLLENTTHAEVRSWSPSQLVISVPRVALGAWSLSLPGDCGPASFEVIVPSRIYIDNNVNSADGFDTITTMQYDPASGAVKQLGAPSSTGLPATGRPGCSHSLALVRSVTIGSDPVINTTLQLYASGNTGVAVFDIDLASGALRLTSNGGGFAAQGTGGRALHSAGAYVWAGTDAGLMAFPFGLDDRLKSASKLSTNSATSIALSGAPPSRLYATRNDGTFDAWSVTYELDVSDLTQRPVLTPLAGSPYGRRVASRLPRGSPIAGRPAATVFSTCRRSPASGCGASTAAGLRRRSARPWC